MENLINYDYIKKYIEDLTPPTSEFMQKLEIFAYYNHGSCFFQLAAYTIYTKTFIIYWWYLL